MPVDCRVRGQIFGQVLPIAAILELIEDAIEDSSLALVGRSCLLLSWQDLRQ